MLPSFSPSIPHSSSTQQGLAEDPVDIYTGIENLLQDDSLYSDLDPTPSGFPDIFDSYAAEVNAANAAKQAGLAVGGGGDAAPSPWCATTAGARAPEIQQHGEECAQRRRFDSGKQNDVVNAAAAALPGPGSLPLPVAVGQGVAGPPGPAFGDHMVRLSDVVAADLQSGPPVPVGLAGHRHVGGATTEMPYLDEEGLEQFPLEEEVNAIPQAALAVGGGGGAAPLRATTAGASEIQHHVEGAAQRRWFDSGKQSGDEDERDQRMYQEYLIEQVVLMLSTVEDEDERHQHMDRMYSYQEYKRLVSNRRFRAPSSSCAISTAGTPSFYVVPFTGPDSKGKNPEQGSWKQKSIKGLRAVAVAAASPPGLPPAPGQRQQQQQGYVGLKKTLELDDDGNGQKWRAHEYTPLLPSDDGTHKLIPSPFSVRVEFKEEERPAFSLSSKRSIDGAPKNGNGPKVATSGVWDHMTRLFVQVTPKDGPNKKKKPSYKVRYAICHHCDQVFNADSKQGTNNLTNHLKSCCNCNCCTHSMAAIGSSKTQPKDLRAVTNADTDTDGVFPAAKVAATATRKTSPQSESPLQRLTSMGEHFVPL